MYKNLFLNFDPENYACETSRMDERQAHTGRLHRVDMAWQIHLA